jgi:hypothetical protein
MCAAVCRVPPQSRNRIDAGEKMLAGREFGDSTGRWTIASSASLANVISVRIRIIVHFDQVTVPHLPNGNLLKSGRAPTGLPPQEQS